MRRSFSRLRTASSTLPHNPASPKYISPLFHRQHKTESFMFGAEKGLGEQVCCRAVSWKRNSTTADLLTKSLLRTKHERFCLMLGMKQWTNENSRRVPSRLQQ